MLWNRSLVMRDLETGTLWSHILGEAMKGPLQGNVLKVLPGVVTTWEDWKNQFPHTTAFIMPRIPLDFRRMVMERNDRYVFGIRVVNREKAYFYEYLAEKELINDVVAQTPILLTHDFTSAYTRVFSRFVEDEIHTFELTDSRDQIKSRLDGSIWNPKTGQELSDNPRQLKILNGIVSYAKAWKSFFPQTVYDDDPDPDPGPIQVPAHNQDNPGE